MYRPGKDSSRISDAVGSLDPATIVIQISSTTKKESSKPRPNPISPKIEHSHPSIMTEIVFSYISSTSIFHFKIYNASGHVHVVAVDNGTGETALGEVVLDGSLLGSR